MFRHISAIVRRAEVINFVMSLIVFTYVRHDILSVTAAIEAIKERCLQKTLRNNNEADKYK